MKTSKENLSIRLKKFVKLDGSYEELRHAYSTALEDGQPFPGPLTTLTIGDIRHALTKRVAGQLTGEQLTAWASLLEGNEHVDYEEPSQKLIAETLFVLATPEINEPITTEFCQRLLVGLA